MTQENYFWAVLQMNVFLETHLVMHGVTVVKIVYHLI